MSQIDNNLGLCVTGGNGAAYLFEISNLPSNANAIMIKANYSAGVSGENYRGIQYDPTNASRAIMGVSSGKLYLLSIGVSTISPIGGYA